MSATMDPYRVLGLPPGASQAEVKRAYRRLAKALHPDAAGEAALPRFLELQDAYELLTGTKVRTVRPPAPTPASATGSSDGAGFREPWRADPARARAAREQARSRRAWPGGRPGSAADGAGGPARRDRATGGATAGAASSTGSPEARPRSDRSRADDPGAGGTGGRAAGEARPGGRRRASRKATMGSTSYDEAREPTDRRWAGASWYGPTTGEYWIVNPREYADPRKHGPGYTSRGRAERSEDEPGVTSETAPSTRSASGPAAAGERSAPATHAAAAGSASAAAAGTAWTTAGRHSASGAPAMSTPGTHGASNGGGRGLDRFLDVVESPASAAWRRLGLVLLAWPPLGLAAATAIGQATGCLSYSASCDGTDRILPWLAQAVILGLLLASPWLARVLGAGTIAALVALVPGVGILTALGGASAAEGGPVLAGWLALAWLAGVAVGARRALLASTESPGSPG